MTLTFDPRISVGNLLTMACGIMVFVVWFVMIETANAERDLKITTLERRVTKNDKMHEDIQTIKVDIGRALAILEERR